MTLKRLLLAMGVVAMFATMAASTASAAVTTGGEWYVGGSTLPTGTHETVTCTIGEHPENEQKLVLTGSVGENHTPVKLTATGIECIEASIFNETSGSTVVGKDSGKLKFTGVTVSEPTGCAVEGGAVTTNALTSELYMDSAESSIAFDKFEPATAGGNFATVKITGSCAAAGSRVVKGFVYGQALDPTGTETVTQGLTFSQSVDETAGSELLFAGNAAHITGRVNNALSSGKAFGAK